MQSINRTAVIIKPKQPFVDWLNSIPGESSDNTIENISSENTTFLIPELFGHKESQAYIKKYMTRYLSLSFLPGIPPKNSGQRKEPGKCFRNGLQ